MSQQPSATTRAWAEGVGIFAGCCLALLGAFQVVTGIAAIANDDVFVRTENYVFQFDLTTWGWIHLVVGALGILIGVSIVAGQSWAFVAGIVIAMLSALSSFTWMPYAPFWAIVILAFDILVIWALSTMWRPRSS